MKKIVGIDPASDDSTVVALVQDGQVVDVSHMLDLSHLEQRLLDMGISPEYLHSSEQGSSHEHLQFMKHRRGRFHARLLDMVRDMHLDKRIVRVPARRRPTSLTSGARKRKRVLQARYAYQRVPTMWYRSEPMTGTFRSELKPLYQIPKTGRLNKTEPEHQHIPRTGRMAEVVRKMREFFK